VEPIDLPRLKRLLSPWWDCVAQWLVSHAESLVVVCSTKEKVMKALSTEFTCATEHLCGKVIGVIATRRAWHALCEALAEHGIHQVVCAACDPGINYLESEHDTMAFDLVEELEAEDAALYVLAANTGSIVFSASVKDHDSERVATLAQALGATHVVEIVCHRNFCRFS
jgi:hypothetical protein